MKTFVEINEMIESIGFPSVYYQFSDGNIPNMPFVVYYYPASDNFSADNIVYSEITQLNIELYTQEKDFASEKQVESVLKENGFFWEKQEAYISEQEVYQVLYLLEVVIKEERNEENG